MLGAPAFSFRVGQEFVGLSRRYCCHTALVGLVCNGGGGGDAAAAAVG